MTRRNALAAMAAVPGALVEAARAEPVEPFVQTVLGRVPCSKLGICLPHEHVMVDFIGADKTGPHRWSADQVCARMLPFLQAARKARVRTFVDCTPAYLGRDVRVLKRLAGETNLRILTNTGYYKEPYLPAHAFALDGDALAARWIAEWTGGIDGTDVRPGFIKIAVNPGALVPIQRKIVRAAALTSRQTGLTIACHSGSGGATLEALAILGEERVAADRFIFVHADGEPDRKLHLECARAGSWVEYDSIGWRPVQEHVELITAYLTDGPVGRLLLSHDGGWYHVGEPGGGEVKPFTVLSEELLPALEKAGVTRAQIHTMTVKNPAAAFAVEPAAAAR